MNRLRIAKQAQVIGTLVEGVVSTDPQANGLKRRIWRRTKFQSRILTQTCSM